jgi:hypothetical protein
MMKFATGTNTRKPCHEARASDHIEQKRKALSSRLRGFHVQKGLPALLAASEFI